MKISVKGRVIDVIDTPSPKGNYVSRRLVVVSEGEDEPAFNFFGKDGVQASNGVRKGDDVEVFGRVTSREWQGKRYADVSGIGLRVLGGAAKDREPGEDDDVDRMPF